MSNHKSDSMRLCFAVGAVLAAFAARPAGAEPTMRATALEPQAAVNSVAVGGVLAITATLSASANLPDGAIVSYTASASVVDATFTNNHSMTGTAVVAARKVVVRLNMPYSWRLAAAGESMNVSIFLTGRPATTGGPAYNLTTSLSTVLATPANGTTTPIAFVGSL
jgi:hypothetical protein